MSLQQATIYLYFVMILLALGTIFVVRRLQDSRIGRAWIALREDEVACQAMAGVVFAAKTTFINPASFTLWESIIILCVVVLGGMGSVLGVIFGALALILLPEYLRVFSEYRLLVFGAILVVMMVFRPGGIISVVRRTYKFKGSST